MGLFGDIVQLQPSPGMSEGSSCALQRASVSPACPVWRVVEAVGKAVSRARSPPASRLQSAVGNFAGGGFFLLTFSDILFGIP